MSSISITAFGSVTIPQNIMPGGATYNGPMDVFVFSPADAAAYAGWSYNSSGQTVSVLTKLSRSTNAVIWNHVFSGTTELLTHAIVDPSGSYVYTSVHNGGSATIQKRNASDGSLVTSSSASTTGAGSWNPGFLRMATISSVTYLALAGNGGTSGKGLFVVKASDLSTVLDIADVSGGLTPWFIQRCCFDVSGNCWIGSYDRDLVKVVVPSGTTTVYQNVWAADTNFGAPSDSAICMMFDPTDGTMVIGDENRPWRKIGNLSTTPSQTQVMESVDAFQNIYQAQFTGLYGSATQEGFGASGAEFQGITCEGGNINAYSIILKHTNLLSDVLVFGQTAPTVGGALFNSGGYWSPDPTATNIFDQILDATVTNPHTGGLTFWTLQPSGTATRWEWFDISISGSGGNCTLSGTWQYPNGAPLANGKLYLLLSQDAQVSGGGGQVSGRNPLVVTLDANGNIAGGTLIFSNDNLSPAGTYYLCSVIAPGGGLVWGQEQVTVTGSAFNFTNFILGVPQNVGQP